VVTPSRRVLTGLATAFGATLAVTFVGLSGCAHGQSQRPPVVRPVEVTEGPSPAESAESVRDPDGDGDNIRDACDRCPDEMETYNGALDLDGCPDRSGVVHALAFHPSHRYGHPLVVIDFDRGSSVVTAEGRRKLEEMVLVLVPTAEGISDRSPDILVFEAEAGACVGRVEAGEPAALATARAEALCGELARRGVPPRLLTIRASGTDPVLVEVHPDHPPPSWTPPRGAQWVVSRARGVVVWRWAGRSFERATPRAEPQYDPPLAEECQYVTP